MRYEFLLQPVTAGSEFAEAPVVAVLLERQASERPDGTWLLKVGAVEVVVSRVREGPRVVALSLGVPLSADLDSIQAVLRAGLEIAEAAKVLLFDPQLSRVCSLSAESAIVDEFRKLGSYAGQYVGVSEALPLSVGAPQNSMDLTVTTKAVLALLVFAGSLFMAWVLASR